MPKTRIHVRCIFDRNSGVAISQPRFFTRKPLFIYFLKENIILRFLDWIRLKYTTVTSILNTFSTKTVFSRKNFTYDAENAKLRP
jgi:hypothetical protein